MTARIAEFRTFMTDVVDLDATRTMLLRSRVAAVGSFLSSSATFGDRLEDDLIPQGSFALKTIIRPGADGEYDADVLVPMVENVDWTPKRYTIELQKALEAGAYADKTTLRKRCVRLDYADDFHIDLVPFVERGGDNYITHRIDDEFILQDPPSFTSWFRDKHADANGHLIRSVRLVKWLRDRSSADVPSVVLTALLADRVRSFWSTDEYRNLPVTLTTLLSALRDYLAPLEAAPWVDDRTGQNLANRWTTTDFKAFKSRLTTWASKAEAALDAPSDESVEAWQNLFGEKFGGTAAKDVDASASGTFGRRRAPGEEDLTEKYGVPVAINRATTATIVGHASSTGKPGRRLRPMSAHGHHVPVGRQLRFTVETDATGDFDVYWKVRNDGPEAARLDGYRGEVRKRGRVITEESKFAGPHWVQAWIVQNGRAIATAYCDVTILPR